ncbi:MAG: hypothetical protein R3D67_18430 [Hyphomicrobiaceae bacterium]
MTHWYFHLPDKMLVLLGWLMFCPLIAWLLPQALRTTLPVRVLEAVTGPVLQAVRAITPAEVPKLALPLAAGIWMTAARMVWFLVCTLAGMRLGLIT